MRESSGFGITLVSTSLSLILNAAVIYTVDRGIAARDARMANEKLAEKLRESGIQVEYVEAPPKALPQKPEAPKKMAERDALNQDVEGLGLGAPDTKALGPADQLEQRRAVASSEPSQEKPMIPETATGEQTKTTNGWGLPAPAESPQAPQQAQSPQKAAPLQQGLTGKDKIQTDQMSRVASAGAHIQGVTSFEATGSGMGVYMKNLKERVWLSWFPYLAFQYPMDFKGADAVISITIDKTGNPKILKVVQSEGTPLFASYCMEAIQRAGNFGPLPEEILALIGKDELEILFAFHYH